MRETTTTDGTLYLRFVSGLTLNVGLSFKKEKGIGGSSPFCSKRHEVLTVRPSILGGVPALTKNTMSMSFSFLV